MEDKDAIMGRTVSAFGGHLLRCYRWQRGPAHSVTSFSTTSSLSWQAQGLQREHCVRARLDAAEEYSGPDSLQAGNEYLAEEQPVLPVNADEQAEGSEDRKAGQQVDLFHIASTVLIVSVYVRQAESVSCRDCAQSWQEVGPVPHSPEGMALLCTARLLVDPA